MMECPCNVISGRECIITDMVHALDTCEKSVYKTWSSDLYLQTSDLEWLLQMLFLMFNTSTKQAVICVSNFGGLGSALADRRTNEKNGRLQKIVEVGRSLVLHYLPRTPFND